MNTKNESDAQPRPIMAIEAATRPRPAHYPKAVLELFGMRLAGRTKRPLGDVFGLQNFGVNLTQLAPGSASSLRHAHLRQDEFVYVIAGTPTLLCAEWAQVLAPGMCVGFRAGTGQPHCLRNESASDVVILEVGDRSAGDVATYADHDLRATSEGAVWYFTHADGRPFEESGR